jgi:hypothetical protein
MSTSCSFIGRDRLNCPRRARLRYQNTICRSRLPKTGEMDGEKQRKNAGGHVGCRGSIRFSCGSPAKRFPDTQTIGVGVAFQAVHGAKKAMETVCFQQSAICCIVRTRANKSKIRVIFYRKKDERVPKSKFRDRKEKGWERIVGKSTIGQVGKRQINCCPEVVP